MNNSTVSIIIPVFNASKYIVETLESIRNQTYSDWEVILVDDGSVDDSVYLINRFIASSNIKAALLAHPERENRGTSASRNLGLRNATGDFVCFLDADDAWDSCFLGFFMDKFNEYEELVMAYGPCIYWHTWAGGNQQDSNDSVQHPGTDTDRIIEPEVLFQLFLEIEDAVPSPSGVMMRRSAVVDVGGWDENFPGMYDDQVLYSKLLLNGGKVYLAGKPLYYYRQHEESLCRIALRDDKLYVSRTTYLNWLKNYLEQISSVDKSLVKVVEAQKTLLEIKNHIDVQFALPGTKLVAVGNIISIVAKMLGDDSRRFSYKVIRYATGYFIAKLCNLANKT